MTKDDYLEFQHFLEQACGIVLGDNRQYLVTSRLNHLMREYKADSPIKLLRMMKTGKSPELSVRIIDAMTTNETFWFRDTPHFDVLNKNIFPELSASKSCRIWSSACSSGQEAYSLSMALHEYSHHNKAFKKDPEIVATDISPAVLAEAKKAEYCSIAISRGMPAGFLKKYFEQRDDCHIIKKQISSRVQFKTLNLLKGYESLGRFDIIFCRNVLIYFSSDIKKNILSRMADVLNPGGYLFLGSSESMVGYSDKFSMINEMGAIYYQKK